MDNRHASAKRRRFRKTAGEIEGGFLANAGGFWPFYDYEKEKNINDDHLDDLDDLYTTITFMADGVKVADKRRSGFR